MPNIAIMNQPSPTCQWTDYYRYIPQTPFGSLIVTYLQSIRNQTVKPEDESINHSCRIRIFKYQCTFSVIFFSFFLWLHQQKLWLAQMWCTLKGPKKTRGIISTQRSDWSNAGLTFTIGFYRKRDWNECLRQCNVQYSRVFPQWRCYSWIKYNCSLCQGSLQQTLIITLITQLVRQQTADINRHLSVWLTTATDSYTHTCKTIKWSDWIASKYVHSTENTSVLPCGRVRCYVDHLSSKNRNTLNCCYNLIPCSSLPCYHIMTN